MSSPPPPPRPQPAFMTAKDVNTAETQSSITTSTPSSTSSVPIISGMNDIADRYDCFLIDMWGVMHDGVKCYDGVIDCIQQLKSQGKELIILSNSSKRKDNCYKMLTKLGLKPVEDFTQIITSGEVAHHLLRHLSTYDDITSTDDDPTSSSSLTAASSVSSSWVPTDIPTTLLKSSSSNLKVFCFGSGDGDADYLRSCGWDLADGMDDADLIVARGPFTILTAQGQISRGTKDDDDSSNGISYEKAMEDALQIAAEHRVPMIVANPDKVRPDADKSPMPGTIGVAYENALLQQKPSMTPNDVEELVLYLGKPFRDVYEIALRGRDRSSACMIGDALETDITGANTAGIDSVWVINDGIHKEDVAQKKGGNGSMDDGCRTVLKEFNSLDGTYAKGRQLKPTYITPHFRW